MEKKYETRIKDIFKETVPLFVDENGKVPMNEIVELGELLNSQLNILRARHKIKNDIYFYCGFFKWNEEGEDVIGDEEVNSWEEAEELQLVLHIKKNSNRKNKREEKLMEDCLTMVNDAVDASLFISTSLDVFLDTSVRLDGEKEYTYKGICSLVKPNFNINHPKHAY
jgi:hypothetical protein